MQVDMGVQGYLNCKQVVRKYEQRDDGDDRMGSCKGGD
jgi:hypothetical protein